MNKIKVILHYNFGDDEEDRFNNIDGESIAERIGQESTNEILNSLDELDNNEAIVQLVDENNNVLKERKVEIHF